MLVGVQGERDRLTLVCAVAGYLGIHRYMAGRWVTGLIWTCTAGIFLLGWLFDLFLLMSGKFRDSDGYFVSNW